MSSEPEVKWYRDWDEQFSNNSGRNEAYKVETKKSVKDRTFFERFKTEDKKYLTEICTKVIAFFDNPIEINDAVTQLIQYSGYTKKTIIDMIKIEKKYIEERRSAEIKKGNQGIVKPVRGMFQINDYQKNVEEFYKIQQFFYDKAKMFWFWNASKFRYEIVDETDLMLMLDDELGFYGQTVTTTMKANYIEAFKRVGRKHHPKEAPLKWIQFRNKAYSLDSGNIYDVTPDYFFTNPLPIELGTSESTPVMDKLFEEWVGIEAREQLYELIAYCCYRDYPIQLLFCLYGSGRNGKSQFLRILDNFIGSDNTTTTELQQLLENRFESFKLYKKLVCLIGETNFNVLTKSSLIKKLVGGDKVSFEKKNKDLFDGYNYAKIIIASNSLPSTDDTSDGFYRRWLIIDFPNEFEENGADVWKSVPEQEYSNLAFKTCTRLRDLLKFGRFTNQGSISDRKEKYIAVSNPMSLFIKKCCKTGVNEFESYGKLYTAYVGYLAQQKKRKVKMKEFKSVLEDEGFYIEKSSKLISGEWKNAYWVEGLSLLDNLDIWDSTSTLFLHMEKSSGKVVPNIPSIPKKTDINMAENYVFDNTKTEDIVYMKCKRCGGFPCSIYVDDEPICRKCLYKV